MSNCCWRNRRWHLLFPHAADLSKTEMRPFRQQRPLRLASGRYWRNAALPEFCKMMRHSFRVWPNAFWFVLTMVWLCMALSCGSSFGEFKVGLVLDRGGKDDK